MKKKVLKGFLVLGLLVAAVFTVTLTSVNADSVYSDINLDQYSLSVDQTAQTNYTLEEMLNYALMDEYMAQAEYNAIIDTFGEVRPFINIVEAEQTHIDLLLPLFSAYGVAIPSNNASDSVIIPDSITSAIATGVEAEKANIAMYQTFLAQDNLPDDVRSAFTYLMNASENHLQAFSQDRYAYYGSDMMNQVRNQFRKAFKGSNDGQQSQSRMQYKYQGSNGKMNGSNYQLNSNGFSGDCPNS